MASIARLDGKVALITVTFMSLVASPGIGAGTAILFCKLGADVVITGRNVENLSKKAEECEKVNGKKIEVVKSDEYLCRDVPHKIVGKRLPSIRIPNIETMIGFQICLKKCQAKSSCLSINYKQSKLQCELNKFKENESNRLVEDELYFYAEIDRSDSNSNICGNETCNQFSTCITTTAGRKICIETECAEPIPSAQMIVNGNLHQVNHFPSTAIYVCNPGFIQIGTSNSIQCPSGKWTTPNMRCQHENILLSNSSLSYEGVVYVYRNGIWGTVCDDGFGITEAHVMCRSLGFARASAVHTSAKLGKGSGDILMDEVRCIGNEETILNCTYITNHDCVHGEDVGITCED